MLLHHDTIGAIDEPSSERMSFRTKPAIKEAIRRAAALSGVDATAFTMNAAYRAAIEAISGRERTMLEPSDHETFFAAFDRPAEPGEKLRAAFARHVATIESK